MCWQHWMFFIGKYTEIHIVSLRFGVNTAIGILDSLEVSSLLELNPHSITDGFRYFFLIYRDFIRLFSLFDLQICGFEHSLFFYLFFFFYLRVLPVFLDTFMLFSLMNGFRLFPQPLEFLSSVILRFRGVATSVILPPTINHLGCSRYVGVLLLVLTIVSLLSPDSISLVQLFSVLFAELLLYSA